MILHLVKCEMCDNHYQFDPLQKLNERDIPESWFSLFQSKDMYGQVSRDFCSVSCLKQWAAIQQAPAIDVQ